MNEKQTLELAQMLERGIGRFDTLDARLKTLESQRARLIGIGGRGDPEKRPFSFAAVIRGMTSGGLENEKAWKGFEREREIGLRALAAGSDVGGGYVVPPEYVAELIPELVAKTAVLESGATQMTGLGASPISVPRLDGGATASWKAENGSLTPTDPSFGQVTLSPKMATAMTQMSRRVVALSNPSIEAIVRNDLTGAISRLLDLAALRGSGVANEPRGVLNTSGIGSTNVAAAGPTIEQVYDALYGLEAANCPMNRVGFVMNPRTWNRLRKLRSDGGGGAGTGPFMVQPDPTAPARMTLAGYPVRLTTQIPITTGATSVGSDVFLADWSELLWAQFGSIVIEATTEGGTAFGDHQVWVKVVLEVDFGVRHAKSFFVLIDCRV